MNKYTPSLLDRHVAQHDKLVHWVVHRQWLGPLSYAEAVHAGRIALWHALQGYDPQRGTAFSTYAVPAIRRAIWRAVADARRDTEACLPLAPPECTPYVGGDPEQEWVEEMHRSLVCQALDQVVHLLPRRLAFLIVARYGLGGHAPQSFAAIGHAWGVSRQRVHQLHTEALLWLAHPAHSVTLRQLLERNTAADYRAYLGRLRAWQRAQRRRR